MNFSSHSTDKKSKPKIVKMIIMVFILGLAILSCFFRTKIANFDLQFFTIFQTSQCYQAVYYLSSPFAFILILILFYNHWNVHQSLVFHIGFQICVYLSSLLQMIISRNTLFIEKEYPPNNCELSSYFSSPANESVISAYIYLSFVTTLFGKKKMNKNSVIKVITYIFAILLILFLNTVLFFQKVYYLMDIIFGLSIGFGVYYMLYCVINQRFERPHQMLYFVKLNIFYFLITNFVLFGVYLFVYFWIRNRDNKYNEIYGSLCPEYKFVHIEYEVFGEGLIFISNLIAILAIKCEYLIIFNKSDDNFSAYNFTFYIDEYTDKDTIASFLTKGTYKQWNDTTFMKYLMRVFISFLVFFISIITMLFINYNESNYIYLKLINKLLPLNLVASFLFFFSKLLFKYFKLSNYIKQE